MRLPPITQEVCKIPLHPSGYTINHYHTTHYGMKDRRIIFQPPFFAESDKNFCAKWFSVLSRTIFRSAPIDFSFSTECFSILSSTKWNFAERCLKHPSAYNANIMKGLTYILKDEWCFAHFTGEAESSRSMGISSPCDLSHHRTCRSAYGGSIITSTLLPY